MSDFLTVPTQFADISELADGLVDRVDENKIILYGPNAFEDGAAIRFAVLLADGSPALEGAGRVLTSIDGGEERAPETRYDVIIDHLELDGRAGVVYERMLMAAGGGDEGPATGEVAIEELEQQQGAVEGAAQAEAAAGPAADFDLSDEEATMVVDAGAVDVELSEAPPAAAPEAEAAPEQELAEEAEPVAAAEAHEGEAPEDAGMYDWGAPDEEATMAVGRRRSSRPPEEAYEREAGSEEAAATEASIEEVAEAPAEEIAEAAGYEGAEASEEPERLSVVGEEEPSLAAEIEAAEAAVAAVDDSTPMADASAERPPERPEPGAPEPPAGFEVARMGSNGSALTRPSLAINWEPEALPAPEGAGDSGLFSYEVGQLPVPPTPPRPDLDPSYHIRPAPRPGAEAAVSEMAAQAYTGAGHAAQPAAEEAWPEQGYEGEPEAEYQEAEYQEEVSEADVAPAGEEVAVSEPPQEISDISELIEEDGEGDDDPEKDWD